MAKITEHFRVVWDEGQNKNLPFTLLQANPEAAQRALKSFNTMDHMKGGRIQHMRKVTFESPWEDLS